MVMQKPWPFSLTLLPLVLSLPLHYKCPEIISRFALWKFTRWKPRYDSMVVGLCKHTINEPRIIISGCEVKLYIRTPTLSPSILFKALLASPGIQDSPLNIHWRFPPQPLVSQPLVKACRDHLMRILTLKDGRSHAVWHTRVPSRPHPFLPHILYFQVPLLLCVSSCYTTCMSSELPVSHWVK